MFRVQAGNDLGSGLIKVIGPVSNMHQDKYTPHISHKIPAESYLFTSIYRGGSTLLNSKNPMDRQSSLCYTVKNLKEEWLARWAVLSATWVPQSRRP